MVFDIQKVRSIFDNCCAQTAEHRPAALSPDETLPIKLFSRFGATLLHK